MTFVETIYNELGQTHNISTADFSTDWLKQSKSYYTSLKTRNIDASNGALVNLLNVLDYNPSVTKTKYWEKIRLQHTPNSSNIKIGIIKTNAIAKTYLQEAI